MAEKFAVKAIFVRQITPGDFWNIERGSQTDSGGGSQTYIDIPLGGGRDLLPILWRFLNATPNETAWPDKTIKVSVLGNPSVTSNLEFGNRQVNSRYKISNQARQKAGSQRHPAWTQGNGFPKAPDNITAKAQSDKIDVSNLRIFIVKTVTNQYFAGFVTSHEMPQDWPKGYSLERLFAAQGGSSDVLEYTPPISPDEVPQIVRDILRAWQDRKNVLLYGPPGTGKTYAMQALWRLLGSEKPLQGLMIDPDDKVNPFSVGGVDLHIPPQPIRQEWVTFHQNYSYENFILGLRPQPSGNSMTLKPRAGVLLDAAISADPKVAQPDQDKAKSAVIFIDEINRGNVSRIFGEFITFMEDDYRASSGAAALPVPLSGVKVQAAGTTEPIERASGSDVTLPAPWYFPGNVYVVASMNSVDRAVAPLDTALARRFVRIEVRPDMNLLATHLGVNGADVLSKAAIPQSKDSETDEGSSVLSASETAWLLLYRLNYELAATLGADFELGHTYMWSLTESDKELERFIRLAQIWDRALYPQLRERFANRPEEMIRLLCMDGNNPPPLFKRRAVPPGSSGSVMPGQQVVIEIPSLEYAFRAGKDNDVQATLRRLAGA